MITQSRPAEIGRKAEWVVQLGCSFEPSAKSEPNNISASSFSQLLNSKFLY